VITKILATRAQQIMGTPIGDSQQGFVPGHQMMKTVMMMMAMVASAREQPEVAEDKSRLILTLDFRKAYDTGSRISVPGDAEVWIFDEICAHDPETARQNASAFRSQSRTFGLAGGSVRNLTKLSVSATSFSASGRGPSTSHTSGQKNRRHQSSRRNRATACVLGIRRRLDGLLG